MTASRASEAILDLASSVESTPSGRRLGNRGFVDGFNGRCGDRSFRFVNDKVA